MPTFVEVIKLFAKFHCLSSYQNDFESKWPVSIPPYISNNESFCVVWIITYATVVLLFKDGSNTLHVILSCILLFTLFTQGFTCGKWFIGYNLSIDDGAESKFGTHKELIVLTILKYKYGVNKSRDMSRDHFAKNRKLLTNWWPV